MVIKSKEISKNVYVVTGDGLPVIIYAPLSGVITECDPEDVRILQSILTGDAPVTHEYEGIISLLSSDSERITIPITHPRQYRKLSVLSNYICNLSCVYCYSAKGRSDKEISSRHMSSAINYLIDGASEGESLSLFFSGGGEPLLSWKIIKPVLTTAIDKARDKGVILQIHFMSNGTVYTSEIADFLRDNHISLCISFEILKDLQDCIRGNYARVKTNILRYLDNGNTLYISSTITPTSVKCLPEMITEVAEKYHGVRTVTMEPVTGPELFESQSAMASFYEIFDEKFIIAEEIAHQCGIVLNTSTKNITEHFVERYCPGKLCLTPNGTFTICHCASSPLEERYDKCKYGFIDEKGGIHFDLDKFSELISINHSYYEECADCFAKVHCGGECMTRRDTYPKEYMNVVCERTRRLVLGELLAELNNG